MFEGAAATTFAGDALRLVVRKAEDRKCKGINCVAGEFERRSCSNHQMHFVVRAVDSFCWIFGKVATFGIYISFQGLR